MRAHEAGAAGVIAGAAVAAAVVEELVVGLDLGAGLFADELLQHGRRKQPLRKAQAADDGAPVALLRKIARVDRRARRPGGSTWPRHSRATAAASVRCRR